MNFKAMVKSSSFFGFVFVLLFSSMLLVYYFYFIRKENYFYLDNPTNQTIKVNINGEVFTINPDSFVKLNLKKGKHSIIIENINKPKKDTFFVVNDVNGLINPTFSEYYVFKKIYGYRKNKDSIVNAHKNIKIDKDFYRGNIERSKNIIISNFDYGLDESFPKIIHKDSINDRTKIYRKQDFTEDYPTIKQ